MQESMDVVSTLTAPPVTTSLGHPPPSDGRTSSPEEFAAHISSFSHAYMLPGLPRSLPESEIVCSTPTSTSQQAPREYVDLLSSLGLVAKHHGQGFILTSSQSPLSNVSLPPVPPAADGSSAVDEKPQGVVDVPTCSHDAADALITPDDVDLQSETSSHGNPLSVHGKSSTEGKQTPASLELGTTRGTVPAAAGISGEDLEPTSEHVFSAVDDALVQLSPPDDDQPVKTGPCPMHDDLRNGNCSPLVPRSPPTNADLEQRDDLLTNTSPFAHTQPIVPVGGEARSSPTHAVTLAASDDMTVSVESYIDNLATAEEPSSDSGQSDGIPIHVTKYAQPAARLDSLVSRSEGLSLEVAHSTTEDGSSPAELAGPASEDIMFQVNHDDPSPEHTTPEVNHCSAHRGNSPSELVSPTCEIGHSVFSDSLTPADVFYSTNDATLKPTSSHRHTGEPVAIASNASVASERCDAEVSVMEDGLSFEDLVPFSLPASQTSAGDDRMSLGFDTHSRPDTGLSTLHSSSDDFATHPDRGANRPTYTLADLKVLAEVLPGHAINSGTQDYVAAFDVCGPDYMDSCETTPKSPGADSLAFDVIPSSSPLPSSSPPLVFSSPAQRSPETSPSSSPPSPADLRRVSAMPHTEDKDDASVRSHTSLKQSLDAERCITSVDLTEDLGRQPKRVKLEEPTPHHLPPNPKRPTQASQAKQRKKLAAPFRSPVIKGPLVHGGLHAVYATGRATPPPSRKPRADEVEESNVEESKPKPGVANRDRTAKAAKQFKSPLQAPSASAAGVSATLQSVPGTFSCIKAAPTIQALQGKVQTLKQAIKIKTSGKEDEDEVLEQLVHKWMAAGREIAWAVWEHVKDLDPGTAPDVGVKSGWFADEDEKVGAKRGFNPDWGYDDEHVAKKARLDEPGMAVEGQEAADEEDEPRVMQHTLGVMLRRLGIDPATLSWDEEEGDFVDA